MHTIRLALETSSHKPVKEYVTEEMAWFPRGADVKIQVAKFTNDTIQSMSTVASLVLEIRDKDDKDGTALITETVAGGSLESCTANTWADGTQQHATINIARAKTALTLPTGRDDDVFWLIVRETDTDGKINVWGGAEIRCVEMGIGAEASAPEPSASYYTAAESLALFALSGDLGGTGYTWIKDSEDNTKKHKVAVTVENGVVKWTVGDAE